MGEPLRQFLVDQARTTKTTTLLKNDRMKTTHIICASIIAAQIAAHCPAADNWTRFRGENGDGHAMPVDMSRFWEGARFKWTHDLPGVGHSSPVVWQDRLFMVLQMIRRRP